MTISKMRAVIGLGVLAGALSVGAVAYSETSVGSTVESRVLLAFKVNDAAIEEKMPEGWTPITLPKGPVAGSNLIVALIDRHLILDAEGVPEGPSSGPIAALLSYGRKEGEQGVRAFVIRVYEEPPLVNPYQNSVAADIDRTSSYTDLGGGDRNQSETWIISPESGGELHLDLDYKIGGFVWSTGGESRPHSSDDPDFFRIYRYDQLAGLAMNSAAGLDLNGKVTFSSTDPELSALFNGSEALVSIVSIPVYLREIALP